MQTYRKETVEYIENREGRYQTSEMCRLLWAFTVCIPHKGFFMHCISCICVPANDMGVSAPGPFGMGISSDIGSFGGTVISE